MKKIILILSLLSISGICAKNWQVVNNGLDGAVNDIFADTVNNRLVVGGVFAHVNGNFSPSLAVCDGTVFDSLGTFRCTPLIAIGQHKGDLVATDCGRILSYKNNTWTPLGLGFNGSAFCFLEKDSLLYVGGGFNSLNNQSASGLVLWNGQTWQNISLPYERGSILDMEFFRNTLYVLGQFPDSTGDTFSKVLRRNCSCGTWTDITFDTSFSAMQTVQGGMTGEYAWASCLEVYQDKLFLGGKFSKADGSSGNSLIYYDGFSWHDVADGLTFQGVGGQIYSGQVNAMHVWNNFLYVGGYFDYAGGTPASNVAIWDGANWWVIGGKFNQSILTITDWNNELYVGGRFTKIDSNTVKYIAKY